MDCPLEKGAEGSVKARTYLANISQEVFRLNGIEVNIKGCIQSE